MFNGNPIPGAKEPLLVKFADGGNKKKALYNKQGDNNGRAWRDNNESITQVFRLLCNMFEIQLFFLNTDLQKSAF